MTSVLVTITGILLILIAIVAIFIPLIPGGPILSYLSILLWYFTIPENVNSEPTFSVLFLVILGGIHFLALVVDYLIPFIGKKFFKFSSSGVWGSILGMIVGFLAFPPLGILLGGILGTLVGEIYHERNLAQSFRITGYATLMNLGVFAFKITLTLVTAYYFLAAAWEYYL